ncbi:MAG: hypothetical protein Q9227_009312 [Pyrenula ochraceoflavens]
MLQANLLKYFSHRTTGHEPSSPEDLRDVVDAPKKPAGLARLSVQDPVDRLSPPASSDGLSRDRKIILEREQGGVSEDTEIGTPPSTPPILQTRIPLRKPQEDTLDAAKDPSTIKTLKHQISSPSDAIATTLSDSSEDLVTEGDCGRQNEHFYTFQQMAPSYLPQLKLLTTSLLPIRYSLQFYKATISDPVVMSFTFVALYADKPIGWIRCELEPQRTPPLIDCRGSILPQKQRQALYISVIALAASHRGRGLATELLSRLFDYAKRSSHNILFAYAHVWEKNSNALEWYEKRGFKQEVCLAEYYRKLTPGGAWIVRKDLER